MSLEKSFVRRHKYKILAITLSAIVIGSVTGTILFIFSQQTTTTALYCYHAGSLTEPYDQFATQWATLNPGYVVYNTPFGSSTAIKQLTEFAKPTDLIGSADYTLIQSMMMKQNPDVSGAQVAIGQNWTDWYIITSRNSMAIAYIAANNPPFLSEILDSTYTWYNVLTNASVKIGRADPYQDPCGYRTLLTWALADTYYGTGGIINASFWAKDVLDASNPTKFNATPTENQTLSKGAEVELISSLEAGVIDYLFIYTSVARQHGLEYIDIPDAVDLSNQSKKAVYNIAQVYRWSTMDPGKITSTPTVNGTAIVYGLTIPNGAPHKEAAEKYVKYMLSSPGVWIDNYQEPIWPYLASNTSALPTILRPYCVNDTDFTW